ncbi:hypothetical protein FSW04_11855 [Baekduia soli]|uniref:LPXTG cell wall anchor domain-containing protein n=1 Tax=Baekduia soli TaxID=496014 RepID=A0A5B8U5H5_9ACTN|nr:hypothetical protein [Baekduia soli]QEC48191.1 hypothetical protein FSW04_11855 [Baekduia soli]
MSRHTIVVLITAVVASVGGMGLAVVAFGQSSDGSGSDAPLSGYTTTTPATTPTSGYTTTTPASGYTVPTVTTPSAGGNAPSTSTGASGPTTTTGRATHANGHRGTPTGTHAVPVKATRPGPTHLAFTGGEPILAGAAGVALMLAGLALQWRRRRGSRLAA